MSNLHSVDRFREKFELQFHELINSLKDNCFYMDQEQYQKIMDEVRGAKIAKIQGQKLTSVQLRRLERYDIAFDKLVAKKVRTGNLIHVACEY